MLNIDFDRCETQKIFDCSPTTKFSIKRFLLNLYNTRPLVTYKFRWEKRGYEYVWPGIMTPGRFIKQKHFGFHSINLVNIKSYQITQQLFVVTFSSFFDSQNAYAKRKNSSQTTRMLERSEPSLFAQSVRYIFSQGNSYKFRCQDK